MAAHRMPSRTPGVRSREYRQGKRVPGFLPLIIIVAVLGTAVGLGLRYYPAQQETPKVNRQAQTSPPAVQQRDVPRADAPQPAPAPEVKAAERPAPVVPQPEAPKVVEPVKVDEVWVPSGHTSWPRGDVSNLCDENAKTKWCMPTNGTWPIIVEFELPKGAECTLSEYRFTAADDMPLRDPKNWVLQGSRDGVEWSDIDRRSEQPVMDRFATSTFQMEATKVYQRFRIIFESNHGDAGFQLSEIAFRGTTSLFAVPDEVDHFNQALPLPTAEQVRSTEPLPAIETTLWNHDGEWAFPGSLGPLGVMAQRCKQKVNLPVKHRRREYRVLRIEEGAPAYGKILPGDFIVGVGGALFSHGNYVNQEVERFKSYREPDWELGRAIETALEEREGLIVLTVRRGTQTGTVSVPLGLTGGFSSTYPWNCSTSQQLCKEIARNYLKEHHGKKTLDPWMASWYGLFLLNFDPVAYRSAIDDIAADVRQELNRRTLGGQVKGVWSGNNTWQMAAESIFLSEYAILTQQCTELHHDLNRYTQLLFESRMLGNLWGHDTWVNYGSMHGGFMGASSQVALALLCLKQAGAVVSQPELDKVLDSLSASIDKKSGHVDYGCSEDNRALLPFDWKAIDSNTSQVTSESIMRQGVVHLVMRNAGRMAEGEATYRYLCRQTVTFATHGMTQDAGVFEGVRALAACDPAACRELLDSYLPRLNLSRRWDGGLRHTPSGRDPSGKDEYGAEERRIDRYMPGVMGLLLSLPAKRLYLFKNVLGPGDKPMLWPARERRTEVNTCSARNLIYGGDSAYYCAPDVASPLRWAVYRYRFDGMGASGKAVAVISNLAESPYELHFWKDKLVVAATGREGAVMVWDPQTGGAHRVLNTYDHSRASLFTEFENALYYLSPQEKTGSGMPYIGGVLWRTRDGVKAERIDPRGDGQPLWGLLHGCASWQSVEPNARTLLAVKLGAGPRLFIRTHECTGNSANWCEPVPGTLSLWMSDGQPGTASLLYRRPKEAERWPGQLQALAVDDNNSRIGSLIGIGYDGRLFFSKDDSLHVSNREGTSFTRFEIAGKVFQKPNTFTTITRGGKPLLVFSAMTADPGRRLLMTDGTQLIANVSAGSDGAFSDIRSVTSVGTTVYFVGITQAHGAELWRSDGTAEGTSLVRDFESGPGHSYVDNLTALGGKIYFTVWQERYGAELWRHDPQTGQLAVADIVPGENSSRPQQVQAAGRWLVFALDAPVGGSGVVRYTEGEPNAYVRFVPVP